MPDTSWNLRGLKDTREQIVEAISAAQSVPASAKTFLIAEIGALPLTAKLVSVDAHCHIVKDKRVLNVTVSPI